MLRPIGQICIDYTLATNFLSSTLHCYRLFVVLLSHSSKIKVQPLPYTSFLILYPSFYLMYSDPLTVF
jgi:hypothetical protein